MCVCVCVGGGGIEEQAFHLYFNIFSSLSI